MLHKKSVSTILISKNLEKYERDQYNNCDLRLVMVYIYISF